MEIGTWAARLPSLFAYFLRRTQRNRRTLLFFGQKGNRWIAPEGRQQDFGSASSADHSNQKSIDNKKTRHYVHNLKKGSKAGVERGHDRRSVGALLQADFAGDELVQEQKQYSIFKKAIWGTKLSTARGKRRT